VISTSPGSVSAETRGAMWTAMPFTIVVGDFDLAGMEASADLDVERANRLGNGAGATQRPVPGRQRWRETHPRATSLHYRTARPITKLIAN
jgi:hypothetical protein